MHFQLVNEQTPEAVSESWGWRLERADGKVLATSFGYRSSQDAARKDIAELRKSAGGMKFAKVLSA